MRHLRTLWIGAVLALMAAAPARGDEEARLTVLHTTDLHGALTGWDYTAGRSTPRGLVRIASMVRAARAEGRPTLLVDAGDALQGGIESALGAGASRSTTQLPPGDPMLAAMDALAYDAFVVGNHEFDRGLSALQRVRGSSRVAWLSANVTGAPKSLLAPSVVRTAGPLRIGIVGVCTPAVPRFLDPKRLGRVRFEDPVAAAQTEATRLRTQERCDAVVLVAHTGLERDPATGAEKSGGTPDENWGWRLANGVPGVDALVLGHSHVVIPSTTIGGVLVTQAGRSGEQLGRIDFTFTRADSLSPWRLSERRARVLAVSDTTSEDPALAALAAPWHAAALQRLGERVGATKQPIDAPLGRLATGPAWELIHRAQLDATGAEVSLAALPDPSVSIAAGPVTRRDLLKLDPYDNTLGVVQMTGADLKEALEQSARYFAHHRFAAGASLVDPAYPAYDYDAAWGVTYAVDLTRAPGERIVGLAYRGAPIPADRKLKVAVNAYRMNGGGGFEAVRRAKRVRSLDLTVSDAIARLLSRGEYVASAAASWRLAPDYLNRLERPLIDRLVRRGALGERDAAELASGEPATAEDVEAWIARAWHLSPPGAMAEPAAWAAAARQSGVQVGPAVNVTAVTEAILRAALRSKYAGLESADGELSEDALGSFRRGLLTGVSADPASSAPVTRAQALGMVSNARYPEIRILETTDFHGAILPGQRRSGRAVGSSPVLAAWIERLRSENPEGTVLIDGGDMFQGTMISNLRFGRPVVEQMNALGYTAAAIGNHEFDWSADTLVQRVTEMRFAALGANMRERRTNKMPWWVRSDTTVARRGVRVSMLGLCYRYTPSVTLSKYVAHLQFLDDSTTAAKLVPQLRPTSDVVVAVGHVPCEADSLRRARSGDLKRLAAIPGIDAVFGGHSHNQVLDTVNGVSLAIAASHGTTIAVCDMVVDPVARRVLERRPRLIETYADEVTPDSAMAARVERWNAEVAPIAAQPLGTNVRRLTRNRGGESALGNFVTDAMREASGVDVAMQNSGGLRADLPEGPVTRGTIFEVMPFDNRVFTLELTGAELKLALEQALRSERVTQVSGIRYQFDLGKPALQRIESLTLADGRPLDLAARYKVAVNDFMATGGDDYDVLSGGKNRRETDIEVREALEERVARLTREGKPIDYAPEGRIERVGATRPRRENN